MVSWVQSWQSRANAFCDFFHLYCPSRGGRQGRVGNVCARPALAAGINLNTDTSDGSTLVVSIEQLESSILSHAQKWVVMLLVRFHLKLGRQMLREKVASSTITLSNNEVWFARLRVPPSAVRSNLRKRCWGKLWSHFAMYSVAPVGEGAVLVCYPLLMTPSFWSELLV